jgi:hypothetical protein
LAAAIAALGLAAAATSSAAESNVALCEQAFIGHGSPKWRSESIVAGPVGVGRHPLSRMSRQGNGLTTKMPLLIEGREPDTVTVSVPPPLRKRVFLYYGTIRNRNGETTGSFSGSPGYSEIVFQLCGNKPRTIWPGGLRVKGDKPVRLLVIVEGERPIPLRLGRPKAYEPR